MKICKIITSVNRPEYLIPTLTSATKFIDWGDHEVDGIFIDDMPTDRNDNEITKLAKENGYNHIVLHKENKGLSYTWEEAHNIIKSIGKDYDFIWQQEDDIIIDKHVKIDDMIEYLNMNDTCYQVQLGRQADWYYPDQKDRQKKDDILMKNWKDFTISTYLSHAFSGSYSLTKAKELFEAIHMWKNGELRPLDDNGPYTFCEGYLYQTMTSYALYKNNYDDWGFSFYDSNKDIITKHIGEWTWGARVSKEYVENSLNQLDGESAGMKWRIERIKEMIENPTVKIDSRGWGKLNN